MLYRRYEELDRDAVRVAFRIIFDDSELEYYDASAFDGPSIVAYTDDGSIGAFILLERTADAPAEVEIAYIGVKKELRSAGIATRLIKLVQEVSSSLWLKVLVENKRAIELYKSLGFKIVETYDTPNGLGANLVWVAK